MLEHGKTPTPKVAAPYLLLAQLLKNKSELLVPTTSMSSQCLLSQVEQLESFSLVKPSGCLWRLYFMTHVQSVTTSYWFNLQIGSRIKVLLSSFTAPTLVLGYHQLSTIQLWMPLTWYFASTWLLTCYSGLEWSCSKESQTMSFLGCPPTAPRVKVRLYHDLQDLTWCDKCPLV